MKSSVFIFIISMSVSVLSLAQNPERERIREIEKAKQEQQVRSTRDQLDSAIMLTDAGRYEEADKKYMYVLKNLKSLPSDLTYHFGRNSYLLGKYSQSVDWLNKYIQLKGTSGQYSEEAVEWLRKAEAALLKEREQQSSEATTILSKNYDIDCGPAGKVTCPVCGGSTVIIKKTYLGDSYKTCGTCHKLGYLNCEDFNKLLRGELKTSN